MSGRGMLFWGDSLKAQIRALLRRSLLRMIAAHLSCIRGMAAVLAGAAVLLACDNIAPSPFRFGKKPVYKLLGENYFSIPENYIDSGGLGGVFIIASWPEMEGRTKENFKRYVKNNLGILVGGGNPARMNIAYRIYLLEETTKGVLKKPEYLGDKYGFEHSVIRYPRAKLENGADTHKDIFVRRRSDGTFEAVMRCSGEPAPKGHVPQCNLWIMYPDFPDLAFRINFGRRHLSSVGAIERSVRDKFREFNEAGKKAFAEIPSARDEFLAQKLAVERQKSNKQ